MSLFRRLGQPSLAASAFVAGLVAASSVWAAEAVPLPGYWETNNTWIFIFHFKTVERKCFTAADVSGVLQGPSNAHYTCHYPVREAGDGHLLLKGTCVETHGQVAQISAEGAYAPTRFELTAKLSTKIAGVPLHGTGITQAHRISEACPAALAKPTKTSD